MSAHGQKRLLDAAVEVDAAALCARSAKRAKHDDGDAAAASDDSDAAPDSAATPGGGEALTVPEEVFRATKVKALRNSLAKQCKAQGRPVPLLCFERWCARSALRKTAGGAADPLLPTGDEDGALLNDLERGGLANAGRIAENLRRGAEKAQQQLREMKPLEGHDYSVWKEDKYHRYDLHVGSMREYHTINKDHYSKLWELYSGEAGAFDEKVYLMLSRYASLGGHGYQAGLVGAAFDVLHAELRVSLECFASPLNCRFKRFCSAFADTDGCFGSLGSFFEFLPREGSFEANPPFVPETMTACVDHIEELLRSPQAGALSFCVVVPVWREVRMWRQLERSEFLRARFVVGAREHSFTDGAQHCTRELHRPSSYDSGIFVLQNEAGAAAYPVPAELEEKMRDAMRGDCVRECVRDNVVYVEE